MTIFSSPGERFQHQPFGELIEREDHQRQRGDAPVRFLKNVIGCQPQVHSFTVSNFKFKPTLSMRHRLFALDFGLWTVDFFDYSWRMALMRILVDGYSLLHNWPELAPGQPRHSARAREELVHVLTRYHDATGTPVTIFFDGAGAPAGTPPHEANPAVEVLFSRAGQTADQMIERAAHRFNAYGEMLVVTDDLAERDVVSGMGGWRRVARISFAWLGMR